MIHWVWVWVTAKKRWWVESKVLLNNNECGSKWYHRWINRMGVLMDHGVHTFHGALITKMEFITSKKERNYKKEYLKWWVWPRLKSFSRGHMSRPGYQERSCTSTASACFCTTTLLVKAKPVYTKKGKEGCEKSKVKSPFVRAVLNLTRLHGLGYFVIT